MKGLFPICVEVEAEVVNPYTFRALSDASVYDTGNSVLPKYPDLRSDSGQYAMIETVPAGSSIQRYQFVAAVAQDPKKGPIPKLKFTKTKGVAYPGGGKFKPLGVCEIDPRAEGCDEEDEIGDGDV